MPKTPISYLQEYCASKGSVPTYEHLSDGTVKDGCFGYRVKFQNITATGTGSTKKAAKHSAALAALKMIHSDLNMMFPDLETPSEKSSSNIQTSDFSMPSDKKKKSLDNDFPGDAMMAPWTELQTTANPIGTLQENLVLVGWDLPVYVDVEARGPPHATIFTVSCKLKNVVVEGSGPTKKVAKRHAAYEMIRKLNELVARDRDGVVQAPNAMALAAELSVARPQTDDEAVIEGTAVKTEEPLERPQSTECEGAAGGTAEPLRLPTSIERTEESLEPLAKLHISAEI